MTSNLPRSTGLIAIACALSLWACKKGSDKDKTVEDKPGATAAEKPADKPARAAKPTSEKPEAAALARAPVKVEKAEPPKPGTFLTFNLGLVDAVGMGSLRLPFIIAAMKKTRAEVACLQEVWDPADVQAVTEGLKGHYPHSFWHDTQDPATYPKAPCKLAQAIAVQRCGTEKCSSKGISLSECVSDENLCKTEYDAFDDDCKRCLAANTKSPTSCAVGVDVAKVYSTEGRNGLLLLSWNKIENPTYTAYDTQLVKRGVITATIDGRTVQCTHLTAGLDVVPFEKGTFQSWDEEHKAQIPAIDKATDADGCRVLLGDMNTGPEGGGLTAEMGANFPEFARVGFTASWNEPQCTFCAENELTGTDTSRWIDHVFFKGCAKDASYAYRRVYDEQITVRKEERDIPTRLSDHYGVLVETTGL